jgi:hypothetical protein
MGVAVALFRAPPFVPCIVASLAMHAAIALRLSAPPAPVVVQAPPPEPSPLNGDSFEMPVEHDPAPATDEPPLTPLPPTANANAYANANANANAHAHADAHAQADADASASAAPPSLFGAVGVRFATDVATTFVRAFAQAASADPEWGNAPLGAAGTADVSLEIDESGHFVSFHVEGAPSTALRRGVERTVTLIAARTFTARGAVTKLRLSATITKDDVHDGLHGDVFALSGGSFTGNVGSAFFALPIGRRIDVDVKLLP